MRRIGLFNLCVGLVVVSGCADDDTRVTTLGVTVSAGPTSATTVEGSSTGVAGSSTSTGEVVTTGVSAGGSSSGTSGEPTSTGSTGSTSSGTTMGVGCEPLVACGEDCVDVSNDPAHCGGCDTPCAGGELCVDSVCQPVCPMGQVECGGACFDTNASAEHCGGCDMPCDPAEVCMGGVCALACDPGLEACNGACVDLQADEANCGGCDKACAGCEQCGAGVCALPAAPPAPGMITGELKPCANAQGAYSVPAVIGATKYTWTVPQGAQVVAGQDTNMATIKFAAQSGQVCVSYNDGCVESKQSCVDVALQGGGGGMKVFSYTGAAQDFVVPACALNVTVELYGAQGGGAKCCDNSIQDDGGKGGYVKATLAATPGDKWSVYVGGKGATEGGAGWNGGAAGGQWGAGGGGGSDVRIGGVGLNNRSLVAGGGGGGNCGCPEHGFGGAGGALVGDPGDAQGGGFTPGGGGTQNAGGTAGTAPGVAGGQGVGGGPAGYHVGGGGGGWYGGGGAYAAGGGGGSSYYGNAMNASTQKGLRAGDGEVRMSW